MNPNPWQVESLDAFSYLCCPECVYRSKEASSFQAHALQNHPQAVALFLGYTSDVAVKEEPQDVHVNVDVNKGIVFKDQEICFLCFSACFDKATALL